METLTVIIVAIAVLVAGYVVASRHEQPMLKLYRVIDSLRLFIGLVFIALLAWNFLRSGVVWMMVVGLIVVAFGGSVVYFEQPHENVR